MLFTRGEVRNVERVRVVVEEQPKSFGYLVVIWTVNIKRLIIGVLIKEARITLQLQR